MTPARPTSPCLRRGHVGAHVLVVDVSTHRTMPATFSVPLRRCITELLADSKRGGGVPLHETLTGSAWSKVERVPANSRLAEVDADLGPTQPLRLRNAFAAGSQPSPSPTTSLLDCLPSLGGCSWPSCSQPLTCSS